MSPRVTAHSSFWPRIYADNLRKMLAMQRLISRSSRARGHGVHGGLSAANVTYASVGCEG
jgi:hypothetical protein